MPAVAGRLSRKALDALAHDPNVESVQLDGRGFGSLTVAVPAIGADRVKQKYTITGKGVRVAILDTGVNSKHVDLKSSVVTTQHCFTQYACPPYNMSEGTSAEDDNGHGSNVSGIVSSDGIVAGAGFAPNADIVAVKINDKNDAGYLSDWTAGLDWIYSNLSTLNVKVINMSFGTADLYTSTSDCDAAWPALAKAIKNLTDAGVTLFAASGNAGSSTKVPSPACHTGVIAVGATYKADVGRQPASGKTYAGEAGSAFGDCSDATTSFDKICCFTNSGPRLDIVAPGAPIVSDYTGSGTSTFWGTSQASPAAAGVAALMLECNPNLTPAEVKDILVRTGVSVADAKSGRSYPSIRAEAAVKAACPAATGADAGVVANGGASGAGGAGGISGVGGSGRDAGGSGGAAGSGAGGVGGTASQNDASTAGSGGARHDGGSSGMAGGASGNAAAGGASTGGSALATGGDSGASGSAQSGGRTGSAGPGNSAGSGKAGCSCRLAGAQGDISSARFGTVVALATAVLCRRRRPRR